MAEDLKLYMVAMAPREGAGDRSVLKEDHLRFVSALGEQGRLFAGGPLIDDATGKSLGNAVFLMRGKSTADIEEIMREEPFIRNGFRSFTVQAWRVAEGDALEISSRHADFRGNGAPTQG